MLRDGDARPRLKRGEGLARDDAGNRNELVAARAMKMIVMCADELESSPSIVEQDLAKRAVGDELFGGAKNR